ncbi:MAG: multi-sensor hybrid histidine kinase [Naasia sp.]|nr:multi-sensor hybrid histidine kinase [Naasia sp.]
MGATDVALRRSGFDVLFEGHPDAAYLYDLADGSYRLNARMADLTGYPTDILARDFVGTAVHPDDRARGVANRDAAAAGESRRYTSRCITAFGDEIPVEVTLVPLRDERHEAVAVLGMARGASDLERALHWNERAESIFRIAGRLAAFGGWEIDAATGFASVTQGIRAPQGASGRRRRYVDWIPESFAPGDASAVRAALDCALRTGQPVDVTARTMGDSVVRMVGEAVLGADGRVARIEGAYTDVTLVVEGGREAQRIEARLTARLDQMGTGILFLDRDWRFFYANQTGQRYLRKPASVLVGGDLWELYPELAGTAFGNTYRHAMTERTVASARDFYPPLNSWFEVVAYPIDDGLAIHVRDVTEDQANRMRLEQTTARLRTQAAMLDAASDVIMVGDLDGRPLYWNRSAEEASGWAIDELPDGRVAEFLYADQDALHLAAAALRRDGHWSGELRRRKRDGSIVLHDCRWQVLRDEDGNPTSFFAVETDITEWRSGEEQRYRNQRMESLGTLAGGIAHDLNNVLTPILMGAQLLADDVDPGRRALVDSIEASAKRGSELIRQVLQFARGEGAERRAVDVSALIDEVAQFARGTLAKDIAVTVDAPAELPPVNADATQLFQVLVNLITNAGDAMPDGGRLQIEATADDRRLTIVVADTGMGMAADVVERAFEPFFTTKAIGRGTGLGLSTSIAIVRAHGGELEADSCPGAGTRMTLRLPVAPDEPGGPAEPGIAVTGRGERILLVDDEEDVCELAGQMLERAGYRTVRVRDGAAALRLVQEEAPDLLIADMLLPGLGGAELVRRVDSLAPGLPVVAMSSFDADTATELRRAEHPARFLQKPFTRDQLLGAVRDALDARAESR